MNLTVNFTPKIICNNNDNIRQKFFLHSNRKIKDDVFISSNTTFGVKDKTKTITETDILNDKLKLLKQIDNILNKSMPIDPMEIFNKLLRVEARKVYEKYDNNYYGNYSETYIEKLLTKAKQDIYRKAESILSDLNKKVQNSKEENYDNELLNRFKSATAIDNFRLDEIYIDYYSGLNKVSTLNEVKEKYPKLILPKTPQEVIAKKIIDCFTKSQYIILKTLMENKVDDNVIDAYFINTVREIIDMLTSNYNGDKTSIEDAVLDTTTRMFGKKFASLTKGVGFDALPETIKVKNKQITPLDIKMLSINYDNFVISTLKKQYLEGKKPTEIKFKEGDITVSIKELNGSDYKIEKPNEKIKSFIQSAKAIYNKERDYEHQSIELLKNRLAYFSDHIVEDDDTILNLIIDFDSCKFTQEDVTQLIKFLQILDDVETGNTNIEETLKKIQYLRPIGTDKINSKERKIVIEQKKLEQQRLLDFKQYCREYDSLLGLMYRNNLDEIATIAAQYRPTNIDSSKKDCEIFKNLIKKHIENGEIKGPNELDAKIRYLHKFLTYQNYEQNNPIYKNAIKNTSTKLIDEISTGHYIVAAEIINNYPASLKGISQEKAQLVNIIKNKAKTNEQAIKGLIKYDKYKTSPQEKQTQITTLLNNFNIKESDVDKYILKHLVEEQYLKVSTKIETLINPKNTVISEFLPSAKEQIYKIKGFPLCLDYYKAFESEMTHLASDKFSNGIQSIGSNNETLKKKFKQEVKIDLEERIYSTKGDYTFDVFGQGLHKRKNTKA